MRGLVLGGLVRSVKDVTIHPESGESFQQLVAVLDTGEDYLSIVRCPRGSENEFRANLDPLVGKEAAVLVGVGKYQNLWYRGLV